MYSNVVALLLTLVICLKSNVKLIIEIWLKTVHFNSKKNVLNIAHLIFPYVSPKGQILLT